MSSLSLIALSNVTRVSTFAESIRTDVGVISMFTRSSFSSVAIVTLLRARPTVGEVVDHVGPGRRDRDLEHEVVLVHAVQPPPRHLPDPPPLCAPEHFGEVGAACRVRVVAD